MKSHRIPTRRSLPYRLMCAIGEVADAYPWLPAAVAVIAVWLGNSWSAQ